MPARLRDDQVMALVDAMHRCASAHNELSAVIATLLEAAPDDGTKRFCAQLVQHLVAPLNEVGATMLILSHALLEDDTRTTHLPPGTVQ